jgi:tRNA threonylcarbamoyladenosine modification (KEOPS) complex  Pcc1 subunit
MLAKPSRIDPLFRRTMRHFKLARASMALRFYRLRQQSAEMGIDITRTHGAHLIDSAAGTSQTSSSNAGEASASSSRRASTNAYLQGLPSRGMSAARPAATVQPNSWAAVASHIRNPANDPRVSNLVAKLEALHERSPTFRARMKKIVDEGGVTITVAAADHLPKAFTNPVLRRIHLSEDVATDAPGAGFRSLPALAVEISNLYRRDEFDALNRHFKNGRLGIEHAARLKETAEYGSVSDMVKFFSEARRGLEQMGFGNPSSWYARIGPFGDVRGAYPTVNDYVRAAVKSGHTAAYEQQFANIATKMKRDGNASASNDPAAAAPNLGAAPSLGKRSLG